VAVVTHGRLEQIGEGLARLQAVARDAGVEVLLDPEEAQKHRLETQGDTSGADLVIVLGGDGTMLRALQRFLGSGIPVLGVNFGRVGFLSSIPAAELEEGLARAFAGEYVSVDLPTIEVTLGEERHTGVNDVVVSSGMLGRMVEIEWEVGGELLTQVPCDGLICSTPSGSTAYNLSNGGPVLVWGMDAMAVTFVAPHSLHARPLVLPRGKDVVARNRTADVPCVVLVDGHGVGEVAPGMQVSIGLGELSSRLATLAGVTFFSRYRQTFMS
jgi:NAD+ kinase